VYESLNIVYREKKHPDLSTEVAQLYLKAKESETFRESEMKRVKTMIASNEAAAAAAEAAAKAKKGGKKPSK
jgi:hypothetical protein